MKNLIICFTAAFVFFFIGCQDNSLTEPIVNEPIDKVQPETSDSYVHGVIPLQNILKDPYQIGNSFYRIYGEIQFDIRIIYMDSRSPSAGLLAGRYLSIYLETNADLQYFSNIYPPSAEDNLSGFISNVSDAFLPVGENTALLLEKNFAIQGRTDGMFLKVRFSVSNDKLELRAMWLALPNVNVVATNINHY